MSRTIQYQCVACNRKYTPAEAPYYCPTCGPEGTLDVLYSWDGPPPTPPGPEAGPGIWRYREILPIEPTSPVPPLLVGNSPCYNLPQLAAELGVAAAYIKDDGRNPTASYKDRASAVAVAKAMELGAKIVACASTGNAAASLAGLSASVGMPTVIFVPETAPVAKLTQLLIFGAKVVRVKGNYDCAFDLCQQACEQWGWYNRNTAVNPMLAEGKKTGALELFSDLNGEVPDVVFISVGDGCILGGLYKGFRDMLELGWISKMPRLVGVQAEGSAPLVEAWQKGWEMPQPMVPHTIADSISVGIPRDARKALRAVRLSQGQFIAVKDEEILAAMRYLGNKVGIFGEPAGVTSLAGAFAMARGGILTPGERIGIFITGNGLKDIQAALSFLQLPEPVEPTISAVETYLKP